MPAFDISTQKWVNAPAGYAPPEPTASPPPQQMSFAQFLVGLAEQGWISPAEHGDWLSGNALPATVAAALETIPETAPDGSMPRLRARSRAMRPSVIDRDNPLLAVMAQLRGATPDQLDEFFRVYAGI